VKGKLTDLQPIDFSPDECARELQRFKQLLDANLELSEGKDILPFFKKHKNLSALIGTKNPYVTRFDCLAYEYDLFGDFACDLVVGDRSKQAYTLLEFEDARRRTLFCKGTKSTHEWGRRCEHGFSQLVDWFWRISDQQNTDAFEERFGSKSPTFTGMLVLGRDSFLEVREQRRLQWRSDKVLIDSKAIFCMTFDGLYAFLREKLTSLEQLGRSTPRRVRRRSGSAKRRGTSAPTRRR
jgi:hypothetical protein